MADARLCVVCFGFDVSQLRACSGCRWVTSKLSRPAKGPCKPTATPIQERQGLLLPTASQNRLEEVQKGNAIVPHPSSLSPRARGGAEQAAFPAWPRSQSTTPGLGYAAELMNCFVLTQGEVSQLARADPRARCC